MGAYIALSSRIRITNRTRRAFTIQLMTCILTKTVFRNLFPRYQLCWSSRHLQVLDTKLRSSSVSCWSVASASAMGILEMTRSRDPSPTAGNSSVPHRYIHLFVLTLPDVHQYSTLAQGLRPDNLVAQRHQSVQVRSSNTPRYTRSGLQDLGPILHC